MLARVSALFLLALPLLVAADCNTGSINCCNSVQQANDPSTVGIFSLLGLAAPLTGQVGFGCSPLTVVGTGKGANCQQQPVCCTGNHFNGLINVGCSPVNINA
ncbi:hypothetical protein HYDPIDRAFT_104286 [Hydnomerulius pinastri MD-312]|nr:hypothetical protein HYDPIDRAFT_104286 [Hydnomerulius pinastri MD-312]